MRKEYIIPVLMIIALAAYLALRSTDQTHYELPKLAALENAKIDRLKLTSGESDPIELVKKDEQWFIEPRGYLADSTKVKKMVQAAAGLAITELVSESANYQRYDLGDDKKINVQVFEEGNKIREFDLGRVAPTFQHTFARLADNPNIYYAKSAMKTTFDQTVKTLRDKSVLSFEVDAVNGLDIRKGDVSLTIAKKEIPAEVDEKKEKETTEEDSATPPPEPEIQWQDAQNQPVDPNSVNRLLGTLSNLKCESYLEDDAKDTLKDPAWTVTVKTDSDSYTLAVFPGPDQEENDRVAATSSANQYAFEFPNHRVEDMGKQVNKLLGIEEEKKEQE